MWPESSSVNSVNLVKKFTAIPEILNFSQGITFFWRDLYLEFLHRFPCVLVLVSFIFQFILSFRWSYKDYHTVLIGFLFYAHASVTDRCVVGIMFLGCLCMSACIWACFLVARYLANQWTEFHQTLVDDVVEVPVVTVETDKFCITQFCILFARVSCFLVLIIFILQFIFVSACHHGLLHCAH